MSSQPELSFCHINFIFAGRALTVQHFRYSEECGAFEELEPIDENLGYDFNFQQATHLPRKHTVLQVSGFNPPLWHDHMVLMAVT